MNSDDARVRYCEGGRLMFHCPGCKCAHWFSDKPPHGWTWNGDQLRPTVSPSILVTGVQPCTPDEARRIMAGEKVEPRPLRCHSFVVDGAIQFLSDCTHELAGKTVPLGPL